MEEFLMNLDERVNKLLNCPEKKLIYLHVYQKRRQNAIEIIKKYITYDEAEEDEILQSFYERYERYEDDPRLKAEAYALLNQPKCPTCGSTNVKKISDFTQLSDMFTFHGNYKQFRCKNCGYKW